MRRGARWLLAALPILVAPVGDGIAGPASEAVGIPEEQDPLATAAVDTWPMQGGCPSRTRATETRAILGDTKIAWSFDAPGTIEEEPRVWGDWVVISSYSEKKNESYLDVLRLTDGRSVVTRRAYPEVTALKPVVWQDFVFAWQGSGVDVLRIVPELHMFSVGQRIPAGDTPLVLPGGDLVLFIGDGIGRRRLGQADAIWTQALHGQPTGSLAAGHGWVYAVTAAGKGYSGRQLLLEALTLSDGVEHDEIALGWEDGRSEDTSVVVARDEVFALHPGGVKLQKGPPAEGSRVGTVGGRPYVAQPIHVRDGVVSAGGRSFFSYTDAGRGEVLAMSSPGEVDPRTRATGWTFSILASDSRHTLFAYESHGPVIARGVHVGSAGAFDVRSLRIAEAHDQPRDVVMIPARETMLVVSTPTRLEARRAPKRSAVAAGPILPSDPSLPRVELPASTAATVDGMLTAGGFAFDPKARRITGGKAPLPIEDVGLIVDKGGRIVHGPDVGFVARALVRVARLKTRAEWIALARKAVQAHDPESLRRAIADVIEHGGRQDDVVIPLQRELTALEHPTALTPKPDARKIVEIEALRVGLRGVEAKSIWTAFASLGDDVPFSYRADVLRAVLAVDATQPDAVNWLRARLPEGTVAPDPFPAADWLDLVEAAAQTPIRGVAPKDGGAATADERALAAARAAWRPDLVGLRSERLLVVTSVAAPARIARCLSLGELLCSTLDGIFAVREKPGISVDPLVIYLFESKEDYVAHSATGGVGADGKARVESTLGHYSPGDGISRLYVPAERDAFERVMSVFAHELTHHWLDRRMPPAPGRDGGSDTTLTPAYFLEEGFATMVEEFHFDLRTREATTLDPRADSLDVVAAAPTLLPWKGLVEMSSTEFRLLDLTPAVEIPCRWTIGIHRNLSPSNLFYSQAAAICHYLFEAEGGKFRPALLAWVQDFHAGKTKGGDVERRLGIDGRQLGAAAYAWSRKTSAGR